MLLHKSLFTCGPKDVFWNSTIVYCRCSMKTVTFVDNGNDIHYVKSTRGKKKQYNQYKKSLIMSFTWF